MDKRFGKKEQLVIPCEIGFLAEAIGYQQNYNMDNLQAELDNMVQSARDQGKKKTNEAHEEIMAMALNNGAVSAHKMVSIGSALAPPRLCFEDKAGEHTTFVTDPTQVAARHTETWSKTWNAFDANFSTKVVQIFKGLRAQHLEEAEALARTIDAPAARVRIALNFFIASTAIWSGNLHLRRLAKLRGTALLQLGCLCKQSVSKLIIPVQERLNNLCLLGKKAGGS